mmetsp:Transcript_26145/g.21554  ORF Transcript_26145/g.21554 Transcript_26145/m.21554 type:complete len:104 (+) Transcript_26145:173-484(+)
MLIRFAPLSSPGGRRTRLFFRRSSKPIPPAHAYGMQRQTINDGHYLTAGDLTNMSHGRRYPTLGFLRSVKYMYNRREVSTSWNERNIAHEEIAAICQEHVYCI